MYVGFYSYCVYCREVLVVILVGGEVGVVVGVVEEAGAVDEATSMDHSKHLTLNFM